MLWNISYYHFKMKGDVISDHFLMLWFQKDSLDTVGFRTFRGRGVEMLLNFTDFLGVFPNCCVVHWHGIIGEAARNTPNADRCAQHTEDTPGHNEHCFVLYLCICLSLFLCLCLFDQVMSIINITLEFENFSDFLAGGKFADKPQRKFDKHCKGQR